MKIVICGSMSAYKEILIAKEALEKMGHLVQSPSFGNLNSELDKDGNSKETASIKIKDDLIKGYFKKIKNSDAILVVNPEKRKIPGYIGGNTFLEIGFAHVLGKDIFILYPYSKELPYADEIDAMQPVILGDNLNSLGNMVLVK